MLYLQSKIGEVEVYPAWREDSVLWASEGNKENVVSGEGNGEPAAG